MTRTRARPVLSHAAAFLAVVLLTLAGVRAGVMQAVQASGVPAAETCLDGSGRSGAGHHGGEAADRTGCDFCVAASVPPLVVAPLALSAPVAVAWSFPPARGVHGPGGPPALQPRARGPPPLLTA